MASDDGEGPWTRQLLLSLAALVGVALLVGLVLAVLTLGAVSVTGLGDSRSSATEEPSLYMPTTEPTTRPEPFPDPVGPSTGATPSEPAASTPTEDDGRKKHRPRARPITLQAFPGHVAPSQRINLTGVYRRGEGATLQVQRFEGGRWADFPVSATVRGGLFETWVVTGRTGANRFRVADPGTGRASNPVSVIVG